MSRLHPQTAPSSDVMLRAFPYPYRAALTICSDIDQTQTCAEFMEIQRFLNTKQLTTVGEGVGLEIGNSFYFYDQKQEFSFFTHNALARHIIIDMIHAGYIDCIHSYGDAAMQRDQVLYALDALNQADCKLDVWINHYGAPSNVSRTFEFRLGICQGDNPTSPIYHTDVTLDYGVRFFWTGAITRIVGQSALRSPYPLMTTFKQCDRLRSTLDFAKETRKMLLGLLGNTRYTLQRHNQLMQVIHLRDGRKVYDFNRYCYHPVNIQQGATSRGLAHAIAPHALNTLKHVQGYMVVYTHLSKNSDCPDVMAPETVTALRNLEQEYRSGSIYVTTTSKLLNYHQAHHYLDWSVHTAGEHLHIIINALEDPIQGPFIPSMRHLQGITFYVPNRDQVDVSIQDRQILDLQRNPVDASGRESVTIPFTRLNFPG